MSPDLKHSPGRTLSAHSLRHTAGTLALRTGIVVIAIEKKPIQESISSSLVERKAMTAPAITNVNISANVPTDIHPIAGREGLLET